MRGATEAAARRGTAVHISIHAPHAGRDTQILERRYDPRDFNPRAPCGARQRYTLESKLEDIISIHAPHAGRDAEIPGCGLCTDNISIHAPHAGRDPVFGLRFTPLVYFNPRAPCGARQQKYTKLLYTLLRQKAILRQFHAKRRLLKRFSTYKYRNTFLICSANRMGKICTLPLRTTRSLDLPEGMPACNQSARFCFRTFFPSSKTADYPAPDP